MVLYLGMEDTSLVASAPLNHQSCPTVPSPRCQWHPLPVQGSQLIQEKTFWALSPGISYPGLGEITRTAPGLVVSFIVSLVGQVMCRNAGFLVDWRGIQGTESKARKK